MERRAMELCSQLLMHTVQRTEYQKVALCQHLLHLHHTGSFKVFVTIDGEDINGSPFVVSSKKLPDASMSTASGPGIAKEVQLKKPTYFTIHTKDKDGNLIN